MTDTMFRGSRGILYTHAPPQKKNSDVQVCRREEEEETSICELPEDGFCGQKKRGQEREARVYHEANEYRKSQNS